MPKKKTATRKKTGTQSKETSGSLLDSIELGGVRIVEAHAKLSIVKNAMPEKMKTKVNVTAGPASSGNIILGHVVVSVDSPESETEAAGSTLSISVHCQCLFACESTPPDAIPDADAQMLNAMTLQIAWPYIRAHISAVSVGMGINPIVLPLMRVKQQPDEE